METILLILTSTQKFHRGFARAIELAKGRKLYVLFVLDKRGVKGMSASLRDMSFIGLKSSGQLTSMVTDEYRLRAVRMLDELEQHASDLNLDCSTRLAMGDFSEEVLRFVENKKPSSIVINRLFDSYLSRYIYKSRYDELVASLSIPIEIVDEDI
ncbi:MAG: hypothetical protein Kow0090_14480 [Myxococcota bacterium]